MGRLSLHPEAGESHPWDVGASVAAYPPLHRCSAWFQSILTLLFCIPRGVWPQLGRSPHPTHLPPPTKTSCPWQVPRPCGQPPARLSLTHSPGARRGVLAQAILCSAPYNPVVKSRASFII